MITITKDIETDLLYDYFDYPKEEILFFDIETTGFSPEKTILYLIGCIYYENDTYKLIQWFADDRSSEYDMLTDFFEFMKSYKLLVHFNGNGFDIPYLLKKCSMYDLDYHFNEIESLDIYKSIIPYKKAFHLPNYKQKTLEQFLEVARVDAYSGGELIQVYSNYLKCKTLDISKGFTSTTTTQFLNLLLLHNEDDLKGLLSVSAILSYVDFFENDFDIQSVKVADNEFIIKAKTCSTLPRPIQCQGSSLHLYANHTDVTFKVPVCMDELKYFYDNYNDYYYLPEEDTAIHKSIAIYVDKDFKTKARAANCYTKKTGVFIPQYEELFSPYFKIKYKDTVSYIELTPKIQEDGAFLNSYIKHLIRKNLSEKSPRLQKKD